MTRKELLEQYEVDSRDIIQSPGKFEGQMLYVPHFWDRHQEGFDDGSDGEGTHYFSVLIEDLMDFPGLRGRGQLALREDRDGNVMEVKEEQYGRED
jgi:hypothetical protein